MADSARGSVSRRDLVAVGIAPATVDGWVRLGLLDRTARGEYRIPGSGQDRVQELATMLWRAGAGARLAGGLACGLYGLAGFSEDESSYISLPSRRQARGVDFTIVRTPVAEVDQAEIRGLPGVTVERALIGAAAVFRPARVRVAYYDAKFKGLTTDAKLVERAVALGQVHGAAKMRWILGTGAMRVESPQELRLARVFRPGDEAPVEQVWIEWHGKWFRLDFAFLAARLALEYDGKTHERQRTKDAERDLALAELQIQTIRVTRDMLADPTELRRRILAVRADRLALGLPPLVAARPPWLSRVQNASTGEAF